MVCMPIICTVGITVFPIVHMNTVMPTVQMMGMHTIIAACQVVRRRRAIRTTPAVCRAAQIWGAIRTTSAVCRAAHRLENIATEKEVGGITGLAMDMVIIKSFSYKMEKQEERLT